VADYSPVYRNGSNPFTMTASATITGGQLLDASGSGTVAPSGAASGVFVGVAAHDCASGARITVWPVAGVVHETTTPAGVTAGAALATAAAGTVNSGTARHPRGRRSAARNRPHDRRRGSQDALDRPLTREEKVDAWFLPGRSPHPHG
jgi:hypothetical protein